MLSNLAPAAELKLNKVDARDAPRSCVAWNTPKRDVHNITTKKKTVKYRYTFVVKTLSFAFLSSTKEGREGKGICLASLTG